MAAFPDPTPRSVQAPDAPGDVLEARWRRFEATMHAMQGSGADAAGAHRPAPEPVVAVAPRSRTWTAAALGAVFGLVVGALIGHALPPRTDPSVELPGFWALTTLYPRTVSDPAPRAAVDVVMLGAPAEAGILPAVRTGRLVPVPRPTSLPRALPAERLDLRPVREANPDQQSRSAVLRVPAPSPRSASVAEAARSGALARIPVVVQFAPPDAELAEAVRVVLARAGARNVRTSSVDRILDAPMVHYASPAQRSAAVEVLRALAPLMAGRGAVPLQGVADGWRGDGLAVFVTSR